MTPYEQLCNYIGTCEDLDKLYARADLVADALYRDLPKDAAAFLETTPAGLDIAPVRAALASLRAYMQGKLARLESETTASPYVVTLSCGTAYVPERERAQHRAWLAGAGLPDPTLPKRTPAL